MRKILLFIGLLICVNIAYSQDPTATLKIATVYDPAPGVVNFPITLEAINNPILGNNLISSWSWYIIYNADVLGDAVNFVNINPTFPSANYLFNVVQDVPAVGWNSIAIIYAAAISSPGTPGMSFLDLQFNYSGGSSTLDWGGLSGFFTNMADDEGNEFVLTLVNGCACISGYDITFQVNDDLGSPIQDALVTMGTESILTNIAGQAVFNRPDGSYPYTITKTGFYNVSGSVTVAGVAQTVPVTMYALGSQFDVTFHVTDGVNNLEGALVTVGSQTALTGLNGEAIISLANGNYNYTVSKYGYTPNAGSFTVASMPQTINVALTMLPQYNITFHVTSGGNNVDGASIDIPGVGTLLTDVAGNAVFSLIDGTYNYTITKTGFAVKTGSTTVSGAAFTIEETLFPLYAITFHVTDGGANLQGASVTVGTQTLVTNAAGNAVFSLIDGAYSYTVTKTGYTPETGNFTVAGANQTIEVPMDLIEYVVTFHASSGGNNISGVLIEVGTLSATTDANGNATMLLSNGDYVYTASKEGFYDEQDAFTVMNGPLTVEIAMIPIPSFAVTIHVTSGGANLPGAEVTIGLQTITTDAGGNAVFNLVNGNYSYTVTKFGYITQNGSFNVLNANLTIQVNMPLFPWTITFHVTSEGQDLSGATVTVNPGNLTGFTGVNGTTTFDLVNGIYTYTVEKANYITQNGTFTVLDAIQTIDVDMPPSPWEVKFHIVSTGGGVEGAAVTCGGTTELTNSSGDAFFYLTNGTYDYTAEKDGYITLTGTVIVNNANQVKNLIMFPVTVTFVVKHNDVAISGAEVTLNGFDPLTTPANGTVVFSVVPDGTHDYTVTHPEYAEVTGTVTVNGASITEQIILVGYDEIASASLHVYPNPSNGMFYFSTADFMGYESTATVYDLSGRVVYNGKLNNSQIQVIDLSAQEKGTYLMQIITNDKVINKTLVIQ